MQRESIVLEGGFTDPVIESQAVFRALMDAMAHPARAYRIGHHAAPSVPIAATAAAVACAVVDADTPVWLDGALAIDAVRTWLGFHTGARFANSPGEAAFALIADGAGMPALQRFAQGTEEYPDRSSTVILQLSALDGGDALAFEGPGIRTRATIAPVGLPAEFPTQWRANRARFPRGVDLILAAGAAIACLPRSARLLAGEN